MYNKEKGTRILCKQQAKRKNTHNDREQWKRDDHHNINTKETRRPQQGQAEQQQLIEQNWERKGENDRTVKARNIT